MVLFNWCIEATEIDVICKSFAVFASPPQPSCIFHLAVVYISSTTTVHFPRRASIRAYSLFNKYHGFPMKLIQTEYRTTAELSFWIYRLSSHNCAQQLASKLLTSSIKILPEWVNLVSKRGWVSIRENGRENDRENGRDKNDKKIKVNF